jgi:hypothetical protein
MKFGMQKRVGLSALLLIVSVSLSACRPETSAVAMGGSIEHPNGLISKIPIGMDATLEPNSIRIVDSLAVRSPLTVTLYLLPPGGPAPEVASGYFGFFGPSYRIKSIGGGGGSGGEEYAFVTARKIGQCWLMVSAIQQSKDGNSGFLNAWAALDHSTVSAKSGC